MAPRSHGDPCSMTQRGKRRTCPCISNINVLSWSPLIIFIRPDASFHSQNLWTIFQYDRSLRSYIQIILKKKQQTWISGFSAYKDQDGRTTTAVIFPEALGYLTPSQVFHSYTYGTAGWLALQAAPLIVSPTIIIALLSPEVREATCM